ncbi:hypothetical protein TIFTF001_036535 [Ficus carica]|uniref:Uncharacterized protein n=1 Tax=Ficus carica TaxID=3494 RepID=A0AA88E809_FICCA|nr:hypothetical protein TIFTF001_036535 [Ficus carica]
MRSAKFTIRPILDPSSKERQLEYYLRMERLEDCSDDVVDGLAKLLEGDVILCSVADSYERNDELRSSQISLDPTTILRSFSASLTHEQMIRASTPVPLGPSQPVRPISRLEPLPPGLVNAWPDADILNPREHQTYMKSMLANHEAVIVQKMEANNKAIMQKIESAMAMNKEACNAGVDVEFEQQLSRGIETRYSGGDNFECQQHPSQDELIRDGGEYGHDMVVGMEADANIEYVKNYEGRPERPRKRAPALLSPYVVQWPKKI